MGVYWIELSIALSSSISSRSNYDLERFRVLSVSIKRLSFSLINDYEFHNMPQPNQTFLSFAKKVTITFLDQWYKKNRLYFMKKLACCAKSVVFWEKISPAAPKSVTFYSWLLDFNYFSTKIPTFFGGFAPIDLQRNRPRASLLGPSAPHYFRASSMPTYFY